MKIRVQVCRGMMCSSYGGGRLLERAFEKALADMGIAEEVELITPHCLGSCDSGPCVRINGQKFLHVNETDVPQLIRDEIIPLIGS